MRVRCKSVQPERDFSYTRHELPLCRYQAVCRKFRCDALLFFLWCTLLLTVAQNCVVGDGGGPARRKHVFFNISIMNSSDVM